MLIKSTLDKVANRLDVFSSDKYELFEPTEKDTFLVSYPRSGNTWLRAIICEILYQTSARSIEELQYYVPDIHINTFKKDVINSDFNAIKSHFPCLINQKKIKKYQKIIYIIRDPRDVVISYYRYLFGRNSYHSDFETFLLDWLNGRIWPCSWQEHINSWIGDSSNKRDFDLQIFRYEELISNTENQIKNLAQMLGCSINIQRAKEITKSTSREQMHLKEKQGMPKHERVESMQFIGSPTSKQWKTKLTNSQSDLIVEYFGRTMKQHGYI